MLRDGDQTAVQRAAEILEQDPFLAARALRVIGANEGRRDWQRKATIPDVVNELGPRGVRALLIEATAQKVFVSRDAEIATALAAPGSTRWRWRRSPATCSRSRASRLRRRLPGRAPARHRQAGGRLRAARGGAADDRALQPALDPLRRMVDVDRPHAPCGRDRAGGEVAATGGHPALPAGEPRLRQRRPDLARERGRFANALAKKCGVYVGRSTPRTWTPS